MKCIGLLVVIATAVLAEENAEVFIGDLVTKVHGVKGQLYAVNESALHIKNFEYDGQGPDAFFWVGTVGVPSREGVILPYPFNGTFFGYEDQSAPVLGAYNGSVDIVLHMPNELKVSQLKWFSVWCRAFSVNFGELIFPRDFSLDKTTYPETTTSHEGHDLPPPLVHPSNAFDDHDHNEDTDVKAEPEPDRHDDRAYPRKGAATSIAATSGIIVLAAAYASYIL